jgi:hypothetical protein
VCVRACVCVCVRAEVNPPGGGGVVLSCVVVVVAGRRGVRACVCGGEDAAVVRRPLANQATCTNHPPQRGLLTASPPSPPVWVGKQAGLIIINNSVGC